MDFSHSPTSASATLHTKRICSDKYHPFLYISHHIHTFILIDPYDNDLNCPSHTKSDPKTDKLDRKQDSNDLGPGPTQSKMADTDINKPDLNENDLEKTQKDEYEDTDTQDEEPSEKDHDGDDHQLSEGEIKDPDQSITGGGNRSKG